MHQIISIAGIMSHDGSVQIWGSEDAAVGATLVVALLVYHQCWHCPTGRLLWSPLPTAFLHPYSERLRHDWYRAPGGYCTGESRVGITGYGILHELRKKIYNRRQILRAVRA